MGRYRALLTEMSKPLLLLPSKAAEIRQLLETREAGVEIDDKIIAAQPQSYIAGSNGFVGPIEVVGGRSVREQHEQQERGYIAVLPLFGTLFQHAGIEMMASGGTSTEAFGQEFQKLAANQTIKAIVIYVHSPGGQAWGTQELSDLIYEARMRGQRVVAMVNSFAASGALWIATAASEVIVTPGGEMGSIGVVRFHVDVSGAESKDGVKTTLIAYPQKKIAGHEFAPLDDSTRDEWLDDIKQTYKRFVDSVARNRGVTTSVVESRFGGGGMLRAQEAVAAGLADRVGTMQQTISREVRALISTRKSVQNRIELMRLGGP